MSAAAANSGLPRSSKTATQRPSKKGKRDAPIGKYFIVIATLTIDLQSWKVRHATRTRVSEKIESSRCENWLRASARPESRARTHAQLTTRKVLVDPWGRPPGGLVLGGLVLGGLVLGGLVLGGLVLGWRGLAWRGLAWRGLAWRGLAWREGVVPQP